ASQQIRSVISLRFPISGADAIANVIDVFQIESSLVGALDGVLNVLAGGPQSECPLLRQSTRGPRPFRVEFVDIFAGIKGNDAQPESILVIAGLLALNSAHADGLAARRLDLDLGEDLIVKSGPLAVQVASRYVVPAPGPDLVVLRPIGWFYQIAASLNFCIR